MIRDALPEDYERIKEIHAQMQLDYALPALDSPLLFVNKVSVDDSGVIVAVCFLRLCAETYLLLSPSLTDTEKIRVIKPLQNAILLEAWNKGIDDIEARIPDCIETRFRKLLTHLGWTKNRSGWNPWSRCTR